MFPFIRCQRQGEAALGNAQLTVDLEPHLCFGIIYLRFQSADSSQLKIRDVGI